MPTRPQSPTPPHDGRKPAGQAGSGAKSAMDEMLRRSGKQPSQSQAPKSGSQSRPHEEKK